MSDEQDMSKFISLADFANIDTDEISELMSRLPAAGIFDVMIEKTGVAMTEPKQEGQAPLFRIAYGHKILAAEPLDKNKDPEDLVGKTIRETYTIFPNDFAEAVGLLKGRYKTVGLENKGRMGGVEGQEPGWLDGAVGHRIRLRVRHANVNGTDRAFFDWLKIEFEEPVA